MRAWPVYYLQLDSAYKTENWGTKSDVVWNIQKTVIPGKFWHDMFLWKSKYDKFAKWTWKWFFKSLKKILSLHGSSDKEGWISEPRGNPALAEIEQFRKNKEILGEESTENLSVFQSSPTCNLIWLNSDWKWHFSKLWSGTVLKLNIYHRFAKFEYWTKSKTFVKYPIVSLCSTYTLKLAIFCYS